MPLITIAGKAGVVFPSLDYIAKHCGSMTLGEILIMQQSEKVASQPKSSTGVGVPR